ncbi:MAG TPA: B12-binding domain-containing protein, partial [Deinococcales bacterium]|nr:B12-binding domain-containing protein [Deinococcales bacterium]
MSADRRASDAVIPLDTGLFTAAEVEARTRVPAATLRQWERRYGLPNPHRADNGYRLYSLSDLACIEFIRNRINEGVPAGRAVELYRLQQERGQDSAGEARPLPLARADELARDLANATIAGDTTRAQEVLAAAHGSMPLESVLLHVIQPSLVEIGERWFRGEVSVAHEHRASAFLRGRLHALLDLAGQARIGPAVVVACAPRERHEIGSLILTIFLRRAGLNAHYLGADMPLDDLIRFAREVK